MKRRKYKTPNTVAEILQHSNIKELSDYLTDPKNNVVSAIIITLDNKGTIYHDANDGLHEVEVYGMLEIAKNGFHDDFSDLEDNDG
jgi:hypothetical protein